MPLRILHPCHPPPLATASSLLLWLLWSREGFSLPTSASSSPNPPHGRSLPSRACRPNSFSLQHPSFVKLTPPRSLLPPTSHLFPFPPPALLDDSLQEAMRDRLEVPLEVCLKYPLPPEIHPILCCPRGRFSPCHFVLCLFSPLVSASKRERLLLSFSKSLQCTRNCTESLRAPCHFVFTANMLNKRGTGNSHFRDKRLKFSMLQTHARGQALSEWQI